MALRFENIDSPDCNSGTFRSDQGHFFAPHFLCPGRLPDPDLDPGYAPASISGSSIEVLPSSYAVFVDRAGATGNLSSTDVVTVKATVTATEYVPFSGDGLLIMRVPSTSVQIGNVTSSNGDSEGYLEFIPGVDESTINIAPDGYAIVAEISGGVIAQGDTAQICTKGSEISTQGGCINTQGGCIDMGGGEILNFATSLNDDSMVTRAEVQELIDQSEVSPLFDTVCLDNFTDQIADPTNAPVLTEGASASVPNGDWDWVYWWQSGSGSTNPSPTATVNVDLNHQINVSSQLPPVGSTSFVVGKYTLGDDSYRRYFTGNNGSHDGLERDHILGVATTLGVSGYSSLIDPEIPLPSGGSVVQNPFSGGSPQGFTINGPYDTFAPKYAEFRMKLGYKDFNGNYTRWTPWVNIGTSPVDNACGGISNTCDGYSLQNIVLPGEPNLRRTFTDQIILIEWTSRYAVSGSGSGGPFNAGDIHSGPFYAMYETPISTTNIGSLEEWTGAGTLAPGSDVTYAATPSHTMTQTLSSGIVTPPATNNTSKVSCIENQLNGNYRIIFSTGLVSGALINHPIGGAFYLAIANA